MPADPLARSVARLTAALRMLNDLRLTDPDTIANLRMSVAQRYREVGAEIPRYGTDFRERGDTYDHSDGDDLDD